MEEIGGKIFVHDSTCLFHNGFFEYSDPFVKKWEGAPDVPYAKKKTEWITRPTFLYWLWSFCNC